MDTRAKLEKSIRLYFSRSTSTRLALRNTLDELAHQLPETVIFGGMLREFALGNARSFKSDIDLVSRASRDEIYSAIRCFSPTVNKFGGFRFSTAGRLFDLWSFEDTWAFRAGVIQGSDFPDILKTTFFNLDAAAYHIGTHEVIYLNGLEHALQERVLDMNLRENPSPSGMAKRAIRMACEKDLFVSPRLCSYILENVNWKDVDRLSRTFIDKLNEHMDSTPCERFRFQAQLELL